jgi:hypothetical protein
MDFLEPSYIVNRVALEEQRLIELKNEIYQVFDTFSSQTGYLQLYFRPDEDSEEELEIDAVLEEIFSKYKDIVSIYTVESITTFDSPGITTGALMIAFVNSVTGLETYLEEWEIV